MPTIKELLEQQKVIKANQDKPKRKPAQQKANDDAATKEAAKQ